MFPTIQIDKGYLKNYLTFLCLMFVAILLLGFVVWSARPVSAHINLHIRQQPPATPVDQQAISLESDQTIQLFLPLMIGRLTGEQPPTDLTASDHTADHTGASLIIQFA